MKKISQAIAWLIFPPKLRLCAEKSKKH